MIKRDVSYLLLAIFFLPIAVTGQSDVLEDQDGKFSIALSYGKLFEVEYGGYGNLFVASVLFPRKKQNFLEIEARYYTAHALKFIEENDKYVGEIWEDTRRPELVLKYDLCLADWRFLKLYINPYAYIYYEQIKTEPYQFLDWSDPTMNYIKEQSAGGSGIGAEFRPVFRITNNLGLFTAINYNLWQLSYINRTYGSVIHSEDDITKSIGESKLFDDSMYWSLGMIWAF